MRLLAALAVVSLFACSCVAPVARPGGRAGLQVPPVLAVSVFENRTDYSGPYDPSQDMAFLVRTAIEQSGKALLADTPQQPGLLEGLVRHGRALVGRESGSAAPPHDARFIVEGVVTDFSVPPPEDSRGRIRVALAVRAVDTRNGRTLPTVKAEGSARASGRSGPVDYTGIRWGGDPFLRTPLGRAAAEASRKASSEILRSLPPSWWEGRVAESSDGFVVINGGDNVKLRKGDRFRVEEPGRIVTDPVSGKVLETLNGKTVGLVEVLKVNPVSAHAAIVEGKASRGDVLVETR